MALNKSDPLGNENRIDSLSTIDKDHFVDTDTLDAEYKEQENIQRNILNQKNIQLAQADLLITKLMKSKEKIGQQNKLDNSKNYFSISKLGVINNYDFEKGYELVRNILSNTFGKGFSLRGRSGSTAVYTSNINKDIVYKIATKDVLKQIYSIIDKDVIYRDNGAYKESVQKINTEVADFFPKGTVLCPQLYVQDMKISPEIIKQFCKDAGINIGYSNLKDSYEIPVTYTTQAFAHEVADKTGISFNFDHTKDSLEKLMGMDVVSRAYSKLGSTSQDVVGLASKDVLIFLDRKFDLLLDQIYSIDPDTSKVKEFFSCIIDYSKQHNEMMDIFGFHNFTFFKNKNGNLDFHVIDPIFDNKPAFDTSLHKKRNKGNIKNGEDFNSFSYPYIIKKMERYIQS